MSAHQDRAGEDSDTHRNKEEERVIKGSEAETAAANGEAPQDWYRPNHDKKRNVNKEDWKYKNE